MRLRHLVFAFALPALSLAAPPDPPESCLEVSDIANLLQSKKGKPDKPSSVNRSAELLLNRSTGADDNIADRPTELELSSLGALASRKLLPSKNITKLALLHILSKVLNKMPGDDLSASIYAPLITAGIIGILCILCAIAATVKLIRNPSIVQNPMSVDELQAKRQHLMALIKANVPRKPWAPPEPISDAPGSTGSLAQDGRDLTGQMCDQMHSQMQGQVHHRMQGQMHGQSPPTHQEQMQMQQERRRDVIVNHPLEGDRLGINLTSDDLVITGILDPRAENFGFFVGERVTHINGVPVESRADFVDALKAAMRNNKLAGYPVVVQVVSQAPAATEPAFLPVYAAPQPQTLYNLPRPNPSEGQFGGNARTTVPAAGSEHAFSVVLEKDNKSSLVGVDLGKLDEDVVVLGVTPGSVAAGKLFLGDVVVSVNGAEAASHQVAASLIAAAESVVNIIIKRNVDHAGKVHQQYSAISEEPVPALPQNDFQTSIPVFQLPSQKSDGIYQMPGPCPPVEPPPAQDKNQHTPHQTIPVQHVFQQPGHVLRYETPPQTLSCHGASAFQQIPIYEAAPQASVSVSPPAGLSSSPLTLPAWSEFPTLSPSLSPRPLSPGHSPQTIPVAMAGGHLDRLDNNHDDVAGKAKFEQGSQETQAAKARPDQKLGDLERMTMDLFDRLDKNHDGEVNRAEFEQGLQEIRASMARPV